MKPLVTVLYEDSKVGREYPLHALLLRMVEDDIDGETWRLHKAVKENPRGGIDEVLADVRVTSLIAGPGLLFVLVDRDQIIRHVNQNALPAEPRLKPNAADAEIVAAILGTSDAPGKLRVFLLRPNLEGLIDTIASCAPGQWPSEIADARNKARFARDFVLAEVAKAAMAAVRACVRSRQPGLDELVRHLAAVIPRDQIGATP